MALIQQRDGSALKPSRQRPVKTLIVDDSSLSQGAIRLLLERQREVEIVGFAADGEEALARTEALRPDLVLMDIQMPKLDGLSATQKIRSLYPETRVIMVTVNHGAEVYQNCIASGAAGLVVKDRLYQDLLAEIRRVLLASCSEESGSFAGGAGQGSPQHPD